MNYRLKNWLTVYLCAIRLVYNGTMRTSKNKCCIKDGVLGKHFNISGSRTFGYSAIFVLITSGEVNAKKSPVPAQELCFSLEEAPCKLGG